MNDNRRSDKDVASPLPNDATLPDFPLNSGEGQQQQPTMTEGFLQQKEDSDNAIASHQTPETNNNNNTSNITHQETKSKAVVEEESIVSSTTETVPEGNDQSRTPSPILPTDTSSSSPPVPTSNETTMTSNSDDATNGECSEDATKSDLAIVTTPMQEDDGEDKSSHVVATVVEDTPRQSFQDVEAGMVIVDENEQGWNANKDETNEEIVQAAAAATVVPKGNSFMENEDTTASEPSNGDFPETLNDVDAEQEVDANNNNSNIMKKAPPTTRMILLQFIGCCVVTLLLVGGSAGAATYLLVYHEGDPPTMAPTVSLAPTVSAIPSSQPSAAPTISPSSSPSSEPTLSSAPSSMPSSSPTPDFRSAVENFLLSKRNINVKNGGINQLAAEWIIQDRLRSGTISLDNLLLQRFALVALEYSLEDALTTTASTSSTTTTARQSIPIPATEIATDLNECNWDGIVCDGDGKVIRVRWPRKNWSGEIPDTIRLLRNLRELDLSENDIRGPLPEALYGLPLLERLYLYKNSIGGTISTRIGLLSRLTHWHLSHNQLTGTIPEQLRSIDGTRPLKYFNVYSNQLSGPLPETLRLRNLVYLDVGRNQLTGRLPDDIGRSCVELRQLHLDHNQFRGTLPVSYNTVGNGRLRSLLINNNQLTGVVSGERTMFNNLFQFVLHENQFTGIDPDNCRMIIPWGEMSEFKADCDICQCSDFFNLCDRFCGRSSSASDTTG
ncbi:two component regulator [Nitzschia inconspicua]|uniref:Two component regulator n=1 Tax=Nitzschia inconspicua TaxID=303405 RepID=A0A9K3KS45_9STRA|nr:two component regulator [Nitzschia inconspicua]